MATVVYRGGLQRRRLTFLLEAAFRRYRDVAFVWVAPNPKVASQDRLRELFNQVLHHRLSPSQRLIIDGRPSAMPASIRELKDALGRQDDPVLAVGFTSLWYARAIARGPLVWFLHGIPEENMMHKAPWLGSAYAQLMWRTAAIGRGPDLVVTVSDPMSELVQDRFGGVTCEAIPSCVDTESFRVSPASDRTFLTYLGSGAPWQGLELLGPIWGALHQRDPDIRFRVISRDSRTKVLDNHLPNSSVEFRSSWDDRDIAAMLGEAQMGFLIRRTHIINRVSSPVKFGEYVAAGVPVIASDLGWDLGSTINTTGCGLLVDPNLSGWEIADAILAFRESVARATTEMEAACAQAARRLDRRTGLEKLVSVLPE